MDNEYKRKVENLKARLKCVQADTFSALKRYINIFSFDKELKRIINQPFTVVDHTKYTLGLDGKRCYGVIVDFDEKKRNKIIEQAYSRMVEQEVDNFRKRFDMYELISSYKGAKNLIEQGTLIPALENQLNHFQTTLNRVVLREVDFKPKCLN